MKLELKVELNLYHSFLCLEFNSKAHKNIFIKKIDKKKKPESSFNKKGGRKDKPIRNLPTQEIVDNVEKVSFFLKIFHPVSSFCCQFNWVVSSLVSRTLQESLAELALEETEDCQRFVC